MAVPFLKYGIVPLVIWGSHLCCILTGSNLLYGHTRLESEVYSELPLHHSRQGKDHVLFMVQLLADGSALINHLE